MLETATAANMNYGFFSSYLITALSLMAVSLMIIYTALVKLEKQKIVKKYAVQFDKMEEMSNKLPFLGHIIEFAKGKNFLDLFEEECNKKRTFKLSLPCSPDIFITSDPAVNQRILQTGFKEGIYQKPKCAIRQFNELLGTGIFLSDGKQWQHHRATVLPFFTKARLQSFVPLFVRNANHLIEILKKKSAESPNGIDMQLYFFRYTLDSFCEIGFGVRLNAMENGGFAERFYEAMQYVTEHNEGRMKTGELWRVKEFFFKDQAYLGHIKFIDDFLYSIIAERKKESFEELSAKNDLLSQLICQEKGISDKDLRDWVMNLMIAGRDTTALTLTWSLFELSQEKNSDIMRRLIEEMSGIMNIAPEDFNSDNITPEYLTENFDYEFQKKQRYLHKVFQETLRMYPPIPINSFETVTDDVIRTSDDKKFHIKKGTVCIYSAWTSQRHPDNFEDPLKYNPDRFDKPVKPFSFLAFNAGPRICLGQEMAYVEAKILLSCLLSQFEFELCDVSKVVPKQSIILTALNGLHVNIRPRK